MTSRPHDDWRRRATVGRGSGRGACRREAAARAKELEAAVRQYLDLKKIKYISAANQRAVCPHCRKYFNVQTEGWDFFCFSPADCLCVIECKTGESRLSKAQREWRERCEKLGIPYLVIRDNVDELMDSL